MGAEVETVGAKFKWNDQFWDDNYNAAAAKFAANVPKGTGKAKNEDSLDDMIDISNSSDSDNDSSSCSSFDGELVIEKSSKPLMKIPSSKDDKDKKSNGSKLEKSEKSKAIKKDKKDKSKKKTKKAK